MTPFPIFPVDPTQAESPEQLGTKRKYWYVASDGQRWLFKAEERGTGEDWSEKIACELAELLGLPHVHYELARELGSNTPGVICVSCTPDPLALVLGNQLLLERDPNYLSDSEHRYAVREHTIEAVVQVLNELELPPSIWLANVPSGITDALGTFSGYILFDAWIANQDRHHENWAAIRDGTRTCLAPTFDHGAALARNLSDSEREERLTSRDRNRQIPAFAKRARSAIYRSTTDKKALLTFEAWHEFAQLTPLAAATWIAKLKTISEDQIQDLIARVPEHRMSKVCQNFVLELLLENQRRLLNCAI